jgi:hypothetical protein
MNKPTFCIKNGVLWIAGAPFDLPFEAAEALMVDGQILVRVEPPVGTIFNRNILAYSDTGLLIWQIEECPHGTQSDKPYMAITKDRAGNIIAANWNGVDYLVNMENGAVATIAFNK